MTHKKLLVSFLKSGLNAHKNEFKYTFKKRNIHISGENPHKKDLR
jgi:hypothetical protein